MILQLIIIQVVTFLVLLFVLRMLFYNQLNSALRRLNHLHEKNLKREEELKEEMEIAKRQKDREMAKTRIEAERLISKARETGEKIQADFRAQAKQQSEQILQEARQKAAAMEMDLLAQDQDRAMEMAVRIFELSFTQKGMVSLQQHLIEELIEEIAALPPERFTVKASKARVISAFPLNAPDKEALSQILGAKMGIGVEIEELNEKVLLGGLIVNLGGLTLDGSLRNKVAKVLPLIRKQFAFSTESFKGESA